jgi:hypothetical protein
VVIHDRFGDPSPVADFSDRRGVVAAVGKDLERGFENPLSSALDLSVQWQGSCDGASLDRAVSRILSTEDAAGRAS